MKTVDVVNVSLHISKAKLSPAAHVIDYNHKE